MTGRWRGRFRTLRAIAYLIRARWLVRNRSLTEWRSLIGASGRHLSPAGLAKAQLWARHVDRAAIRLPGRSKCLPQAIALSQILRIESIPHELVIAARPQEHRSNLDSDDLHAWIECDGTIVLGDLPGPWAELVRI